MKIIYATTEFITEKNFDGGLASYIANISTIFAQHGHKTIIVVISDRNDVFLWKDGVQVECVNGKDGIWYSFLSRCRLSLNAVGLKRIVNRLCDPCVWLLNSHLLNRRIKHICRQEKIDIVQYASYMATALFRFREIPSVARLSSYEPLWRNAYKQFYNFNDALHDIRLLDRMELLAIKSCDAVFGPSRLIADIIGNKTHRTVDLIESSFQTNNDTLDRSVYENELKDLRYLLTFGALGYLKGTHIIAEVVYGVLKQYPELHIVLIGKDCGYRQGLNMVDHVMQCAGEFADRVHYFPALKKEALYPIIQNAQACVLPSRIDNLPNTCIEAMSLSRVVIGTRGASFEQMIEDGVSGFLCEIDSPSSLAGCIDRAMALSDRELNKMGLKARERTLEMQPEIAYQNHLREYRQVISKYHGQHQPPIIDDNES